MANEKRALAGLLGREAIRSQATPSNMRLGEQIFEEGGVELVETDSTRVVARVRPKGGVRRTVELRSTGDGLTCRCTCTRNALFCKHCVAAALAVGGR